MLKRIIYTDFGQFVAALKSAERLGLRYRAGRKEVTGTTPVQRPAKEQETSTTFFTPIKYETVDQPITWVEYTLDILPDETEAGEEQATA